MKKLIILCALVLLSITGCIYYPYPYGGYSAGYGYYGYPYGGYYYPYGYVYPDVSLSFGFISGHGGHHGHWH
jgi:hypothetical protein